jgi:hypothetical protein
MLILDRANRRGSRYFSVAAVFGMLAASAGAIKADSIAYEAASSRDFGTVDLNTGVYTEIGVSPNVPIAGLGEIGGTLYAAGSIGNTNTLYSVDPATGGLTAIGNGTFAANYGDFGSTTTGLYGVGSWPGLGGEVVLWSIDPSTGATTLIGPTGTGLGVSSLSNNSNTLFFNNGASLYTLDTTTGLATLIGSSFPFEAVAMVFENGTLYGAHDNPCCSFDTLDTSTGAATFVANESGGPNGGLVVALAPVVSSASSVPEPGYAGLLGLLSIVFALTRRNHRI